MRYLAVISLLALSFAGSAQFSNFQSLNSSYESRNAALGGHVVSLADGDVLQYLHNPAVLDSVQAGAAGLVFSPMFSGIYEFTGAYQSHIGPVGNLAFGISYTDYGDFTETADNGDELGSFTAHDLMFSTGKSHSIGPFTLGASLKYATSTIAGYGSHLLLADFGGIYRSPASDFTLGMAFKNLGFVLADYAGTADGSVPFDVEISTTFKPEHMPFRFSLSAYNLTGNGLYFQEEREVSQSGTVKVADKIFRHVNVGTELVLHKNFQLLLGYSHLMHQELRIDDSAYGAGFSYGFSLKIRQVALRYAHAKYHAAGGSDYFTLLINTQSFKKIL